MKKILVALILVWFVCCGFTFVSSDAKLKSCYVRSTGSEKVTNGTFSADTDWTKDADWTISGNVANKAAGAAGRQLAQDINAVAGTPYLLSLQATISASYFYAYCGGGEVDIPVNVTGNYSARCNWGGTDWVTFLASASCVATLDNVSVKEITKAIIKKGRVRGGMDLTN